MNKKQEYVNLLVYGTLKRGGALSSHLRNSEFLNEEKVHGFEMFNLGWYPGIKKGPGTIYGEIYSIPVELLSSLDRVEGVPYLYDREEIITSHGVTYVYVYQGTPEDGSIIESGVWQV